MIVFVFLECLKCPTLSVGEGVKCSFTAYSRHCDLFHLKLAPIWIEYMLTLDTAELGESELEMTPLFSMITMGNKHKFSNDFALANQERWAQIWEWLDTTVLGRHAWPSKDNHKTVCVLLGEVSFHLLSNNSTYSLIVFSTFDSACVEQVGYSKQKQRPICHHCELTGPHAEMMLLVQK